MRMSSLTGVSEAPEQLRRLVERQAHHSRIAAAQLDDEARRATLDGIGTGLVVALAGSDVVADLVVGERLERDLRHRQRALEVFLVLERDRGKHLVPARS